MSSFRRNLLQIVTNIAFGLKDSYNNLRDSLYHNIVLNKLTGYTRCKDLCKLQFSCDIYCFKMTSEAVCVTIVIAFATETEICLKIKKVAEILDDSLIEE